MSEITILMTVFDKVMNVLGLIRDNKIKRDEKIDASLYVLYAALTETKAYMVALKKNGRRNTRQEHNLAKLWHDASVPLRKIEPELAHICFMKGTYWLEPEAWDKSSINRNKIALDHVFEQTRELLIGKNMP